MSCHTLSLISTTMSQPILNVHTPTSSFAIIHSITQDTLSQLQDKLTRKVSDLYHNSRVGHGWLKYESSGSIWNLDDESDYAIFVWRQHQTSSPSTLSTTTNTESPTLYLHDPRLPLPTPPAYTNPSYYVYAIAAATRAQEHSITASSRPGSQKSRKTKGSKRSAATKQDDGVPTFKRDFEQFQMEHGVRTVIGDIGPVTGIRMLLREGHRHVYISRKFAAKHGFIPKDARLGHYGFGGLVNIGKWPITLRIAEQDDATQKQDPKRGEVLVSVYLAEETHFDIVLGRSFFEKRQIKLSPLDPTEVICLDNGDKIGCELVILKDGLGGIVTVT